MNSKQRYELIKSSLTVLVDVSRAGDFSIFENADQPDEFVQVKYLGPGAFRAEVGSREWADPTNPLAGDVRQQLADLGFAGGAPERNYSCSDLPATARAAAKLLHRAFEVAYGRRGTDLVVKTNCPELEAWLRERDLWVAQPIVLPVAEPIRLDMVRAAMQARGWRVFLVEHTGDLMTYWGWDRGLGQDVHVYFSIAGNAPWKVLTISAVGGEPIFDTEHGAVLEMLNEWNDAHRWPCASLGRQKDEDFSWLHLSWSLPAAGGVSKGMVSDVIEVITDHALEFFRWFNATRQEPAQRTPVLADGSTP